MDPKRLLSQILRTAEDVSSNAAGMKALRAAEKELRAGRKLSSELMKKVDDLIKRTRIAARGAARSSVPKEVKNAFEKLASKYMILNDLDELSIKRVLSKRNADHMEGQLLEELLEARVVPMTRDPAGKMALLGLDDPFVRIEFIPGHLLSDAGGSPITDGIIVRRLGDALDDGFEVLAIFEAKAGTASARGLYRKRGKLTNEDRIERPRYAREIFEELQERARKEGKKVKTTLAEIEKKLPRTETGQIKQDVERLVENFESTAKIGYNSDLVPITLSPTKVKFFGVTPYDVSSSMITNALKKQLEELSIKVNFEIFGINITQHQLKEIVRELSKALAKTSAS